MGKNEIVTVAVTGGEYRKHETAYIDEGAVIGAGTRIWHFTHVMPGARIGERCSLGQNVNVGSRAVLGNGVKVQNNVSLYDEVYIEDDAFCGPSCVFTNVFNPRSFIERKSEYRKTVVHRGATIGANATIVCGSELGEYCFVGAGSVVTRNVPPHALVHGSPARLHGWVCQCGVKLDGSLTCPECGLKYKKQGEGLALALQAACDTSTDQRR